MTLIDIDDGAAKERLRELAAANKASLDARMRQVAALNEQARAAVERDEAELKAALARKAEVQAKAAAAAAPVEAKPKRTLSLGAAEFAEERAARQAAPPPPQQPQTRQQPQTPQQRQTPQTPPPPVAPVQEKGQAAPRRTLRLGADDDRGAENAEEQPAKKRDRPVRPRPAAGDDDMSGRTWLR